MLGESPLLADHIHKAQAKASVEKKTRTTAPPGIFHELNPALSVWQSTSLPDERHSMIA
jgi:hypothetical protein